MTELTSIDQAPRTRAEANRENAKKSTGPRTPEGKAKSAQNAMKHGMTGQVTIMPGEDREAHDRFCADIMAGYAPEGAIEIQIAHSIAETEWRLNRASAIEQNILAAGIEGPEGNIDADHPEIHTAAAMAAVFVKQQSTFANLTLYESRLQRSIQKSEARLRVFQTERSQATHTAVARTEVLAAHAAGVGVSYDPAPDFPPQRGFVYSTEKITQMISRDQRLKAARDFDYRQRHPETPDEDAA